MEVLEGATAQTRIGFEWRRQVVRAGKNVAGGGEHVAGRGKRYGAAGFGHALATRSDAHDLVVAHNDALVSVSMAARSSAMKAAPRRRAASACSHTPAAAASNGAMPPASIAAITPASTSPVPAVESQSLASQAIRAAPSGAAMTVSAPLKTMTTPASQAAARARSILQIGRAHV